jgi:hypothetical protein
MSRRASTAQSSLQCWTTLIIDECALDDLFESIDVEPERAH